MQSALQLIEFDLYRDVKTPVALPNYRPGAWILYARIIDQSGTTHKAAQHVPRCTPNIYIYIYITQHQIYKLCPPNI